MQKLLHFEELTTWIIPKTRFQLWPFSIKSVSQTLHLHFTIPCPVLAITAITLLQACSAYCSQQGKTVWWNGYFWDSLWICFSLGIFLKEIKTPHCCVSFQLNLPDRITRVRLWEWSLKSVFSFKCQYTGRGRWGSEGRNLQFLFAPRDVP